MAILLTLFGSALTPVAQAETLRIASFHTGFGRAGPGLLLRDIRRQEPDITTATNTIVAMAPDVILLLDFDWDMNNAALVAFQSLLAEAGHPMPFSLSPRPNTGLSTGMDMDGDGRRGTPDDAQGWARFSGAGAMALLSRWPIERGALIDHTAFLWRDLPNARLPRRADRLFPNPEVFDIQRLASVGAWEVPVVVNGHALWFWAYHAGPPAFGGSENRNFNRNADETAFWRHRLDEGADDTPATPFVLLGDANLDAQAGDGSHVDIRALLAHPALQDPRPIGPFPAAGAPSDVTGHWPDGPGDLRVDYVLPSADLLVLRSGLAWPSPEARHAMVWVDLNWPP